EGGGIDTDRLSFERGGKFVVRVHDEHAQVRAYLDRPAQQQGNRRGFADAGGADYSTVPVQRGVDGDAGLEALILRQLADHDGVTAREVVDGIEVARADVVGDRADMRIDRDAAIEDRLAAQRFVTYFADQFDADLDAVVAVLAPDPVRLVDGIDQPDG